MKSFLRPFGKFAKDTRGTIAVITAIVIFPLLFYCVGVPIDLARQVQLRSALQNIADGAALAGSAVLGEGGTASQACTIANNFVKASSSTGLSVSYSALTPTGNFASTSSFIAQGQASATIGCGTNAPNTTSLANLEATTPNQVVVSISTVLPTVFMSFVKKTLPVSVTATAVGPSNTITICVLPKVSGSIDYDALWFYGYVPGTGVKETVGVNGTAPMTFTEPVNGASATGVDPSLDPQKLEFLLDDNGNQPTGALTGLASSPCPKNYAAVAIHLPVGTRLGFEMTAERGGIDPCPYIQGENYRGYAAGIPNLVATSTATFACIQNDKETYGYPASEGARAYDTFFTDAYGASVFTTMRFYSTDYPVSLNASTTSTISSGDTTGTGPTQNPLGGDSRGDYGVINQTLVANTNYPGTDAGEFGSYEAYVGAPGYSPNSPQIPPHILIFNSRVAIAQGLNANYGVATETNDLVCEVNNGQAVPPSQYTETQVNNANTGLDFSNITITAGQQQNLTVVNSSKGNVLQCANTTDGDPYNIDPTCKQLNGATLTAFWNDMGSPTFDNVNYGDLPYSIQCIAQSGIPTLDYQNTALDQ
jgi:Flp pilus assembly protein TadG